MKCDWCQDVNDLRPDKKMALLKNSLAMPYDQILSRQSHVVYIKIVCTFIKIRKITSYGQIVSRQYVTRLKSNVAYSVLAL